MFRFVVFVVVVPSFLLSLGASAAIDPNPIGDTNLIPTLRVEHKRDDNIFSSATAEKSSTITNIMPKLEYLAEADRFNFLSMTYDGNFARYWDSRDDDFADHTFAVKGGVSGGESIRFSGEASKAKLHDNRGEGASEGLVAPANGEPDEFDKNIAGLTIDLGRYMGRLGAQASLKRTDYKYTNNRTITAFRDREDTTANGRIFATLSGKTRAFVGYRRNEIEYDRNTLAGTTLDSEETTALIGLEWDITGKTSGNIEVGRLDKDFDSPTFKDGDFTSWQVGVAWQPRTYSTIALNSSRKAGETNGTGNFIEQTNHSVSWTHNWSGRLQTLVSMAVGDDEFPGATRQDDRESLTLGVNYDWRRWANIGLRVQDSERDSNDPSLDYDRRQILLILNLSL